MQIREFQKPITAKVLNENLAKKFGYKINFEQFTDVQLEDARNKLRTRLSQMELSEAFDSVLESPQYQKTRLMLDCINQEIMERDDKADKDYDGDGEVESGKDEYMGSKDKAIKKAMGKKEEKTDEGYIVNTVRARAKELSVPETWINKTIAQINLGEGVDREELKAELALRYDLNESQASWILLEGEEDKAETIMATKDMVDRITGWLEDVAAMKAEQLLELLDSIRETQGSDVAQSYQEAVKPALEAIYTALETSRQGLSNALSIVSGGEVSTMGAPAGAPMPGAEEEAVPPMPGAEGEMGAEELPTPPAPEVGREKRESVDYSRRLALLLNSKKKVSETIDPLVRTLFTAQGAGDNQQTKAPMTWGALQNMGIPISYEAFAARWEEEEGLPPEQQILHNLVVRFDGSGVTVKTQDAKQKPEVKGAEDSGVVSQMAKRATKLGK